MSGLLELDEPWGSQPQEVAELVPGWQAVWTPSIGRHKASSDVAFGPLPSALAASVTAATGYVNLGRLELPTTTRTPVLIVQVAWTIPYTTAQPFVCGYYDGSDNLFQVTLNTAGAADGPDTGNFCFTTQSNGSSNILQTNAVWNTAPYADGKLHTFVIVGSPGYATEMWVDGVSKSIRNTIYGSLQTTPVFTPGDVWLLNADNPRHGVYNSGNTDVKVALFAYGVNHRIDAKDASINPYPWLFAPRQVSIPVSAAGGGTTVTCGVGAATAAGHPVGIALHTAIAAGVGAATAVGHQADVTSHTAIDVDVGAAVAAGHQATITIGSGTTIACTVGAAVAQGHSAAIGLGITVSCGVGAATAAGHQVAIAEHTVVSAGVGAATSQGLQVGIALHTVIACGVGAAAGSGEQAAISSHTIIACGVGQAAAAGHQATINIGNGTTIGCNVGAAVAQGHPAGIGLGTTISCGVGAATAAGHLVAIAQHTVISGNVAQATAQGLQAGIVLRTVVAAGVGTANARGYQATITFGGVAPEYPLCLTVEISAEMVLHVRTGNPISTIDVLIQADTRFKPRVLSC